MKPRVSLSNLKGQKFSDHKLKHWNDVFKLVNVWNNLNKETKESRSYTGFLKKTHEKLGVLVDVLTEHDN